MYAARVRREILALIDAIHAKAGLALIDREFRIVNFGS